MLNRVAQTLEIGIANLLVTKAQKCAYLSNNEIDSNFASGKKTICKILNY